jgi:selenide,water dikinase
MQAECRARWFDPLLHSMLLSNQFAASLCDKFDVAGVTDVTGFGLAGHLLEMLRPSQVGAVLRLRQIPLLPGAAELFASGRESTLAPDNRWVAGELEFGDGPTLHKLPEYAALFDPQTSGGLLLGVPEKNLPAVLAQLAQQSQVPAAHIGHVVEHSGDGPRVRCVRG